MTRQVLPETEARNERVSSIISSAYRIIGHRGFVNVSLSDIAAEAGVSKALLHYYFKNKEELVGEIYRYAMSEFLETAAAIFAGKAKLEQKIGWLFNAFDDYLKARPEWFAVVMELTLQGIRHRDRIGEILAQHLEIRDLTSGMLKEAQKEEKLAAGIDPEIVASVMVAMANGFALSRLIAPGATDSPRFIDYFKAMVLELMKKGKQTGARRRGGLKQ